VAVEESVDEMKIAGSAAAGADSELARQMRFGGCGESGNLFMPNMHPFDLALAAKRIGQPVQTVTNDTVDPLYARGGQSRDELLGNGDHESSCVLGRLGR
jgi:hypothetical protein